MQVVLRNLFIALLFFIGANVSAQTLTGTYSLPGTVNGNTVNNLSQLAAVLNSATVSGTVVFEFGPAYAGGETFPVAFNQFAGTGNVIIRPSAAVNTQLLTSGNPSTYALIYLSGVKHLTFDGRAGGVDTTIMWKFQNTGVTSAYPAFRFVSAASYDTLQYLTVLSSGGISTGTIVLDTSTVGGNSFDCIQNCNIGNYAGYPYNPIKAFGTAGNLNSDNSIKNNNIYNFQVTSNNSPFYAGINVAATGNGSNWTITGNSIFSSINPLSLGNNPYRGIYFTAGANSNNNNISGNYIGGEQVHCGGAAWQVPSYGANGYADFDGIYFAGGATSNVISNNTIQNIWMASKYGSSTFRGINIVSGSAEVRNNIIGSATDTSSIISGIYGTMLGIQNQSTTAVLIDNNTVANFTSDIRSYVSGTSSMTTGVTIGIFGYNGNAVLGSNTITNNKVFNLSRKDNYNNAYIYYPVPSGGGISGGQNNITQMNIIAGISVQTAGSGAQTISKNQVYNLYTLITGGTNNIYINGVVVNSGTGANTNIDGNLIYGLHAPNAFGTSTTNYSGLTGIYLPASSTGIYTVTNNMVQLGYRPTDGSTVTKAVISGIWDNSSAYSPNLKMRVYHNSVYIGGSDNSAYKTYAFRRMTSSSTTNYDSLTLKNNIFYNGRNNSSTGLQYGIYINSGTITAIDYNDIYGTSSKFIYGDLANIDYATRALWTAAVSPQEANGLTVDPQYINATTAVPNLHISTMPSLPSIDAAGTLSATVTYDYDSSIRANFSPVDMGAAVVGSGSSCTVSVALVSSVATVCNGKNVTFTATATNGGTAPTYNFYLNGTSVQNGSSNTYSNSNLHNNDSVKVVLTSNAACASTVIATSTSIKVTVLPTSTSSIAQTVCYGQSYLGHNATGTFRDTLIAANGCDSIRTLNLTVRPQNATTIAQTICYGATYAGHNTTGTFTDTYTAANGCDSIRTLNLIIRPQNTTTVSKAICSGQSYGGHSINGTYIDTFVAANGCDSIRTLQLTVNNAITSNLITSICQGQSYGGHSTQGTYADTFIAGGGCDSIRYLSLSIRPAITYNISQTICQGQIYEGHNTQGTFVDTFASPNTCDSIRTLNLTVLQSVTGSEAKTICYGQSYAGHGSTGTFIDTLIGSNTCDSIRTLHLTVLTQNATTITQTICFGTSYEGHSTTGTFIDTFTSASNCDSIRTLNLTVRNQITSLVTKDICTGQTFEGYNASGTYIDTFMSASNCDSIRTLVLNVQSVIRISTIQDICSGDSYMGYTQPGTYVDTFAATGGCDSIRTLILEVSPSYHDTLVFTLCQGDTLQGHTVTGVYIDSLHSITGCDSIIMLNLTFNPLPIAPAITKHNDTLESSGGITYQWYRNDTIINGATANTLPSIHNGSYSVAVTDINGCSNTSSAYVVTGVGIAEVSSNPFISLYPNPTTGVLNISLSELSGAAPVELKLYDAIGQLVYSNTFAAKGNALTAQVQLDQYPQGLLMLQVKQGNWNISKRIVLVK